MSVALKRDFNVSLLIVDPDLQLYKISLKRLESEVTERHCPDPFYSAEYPQTVLSVNLLFIQK